MARTGFDKRRNGEKWAKMLNRELVDGRGGYRIWAGEWRHVIRFELRDDYHLVRRFWSVFGRR